jgi:YHS domain-containing protein
MIVTGALDLIGGMMVEVVNAHCVSEYGDAQYYFCSAGCKRTFDREQEKYIAVKPDTS